MKKSVFGLILIIAVWVMITGFIAWWIALDERYLQHIDAGKAVAFLVSVMTVICLCYANETRIVAAKVWSGIGIAAFALCVSTAVLWMRPLFDVAVVVFVLSIATTYFVVISTEIPVQQEKPWFRVANRF